MSQLDPTSAGEKYEKLTEKKFARENEENYETEEEDSSAINFSAENTTKRKIERINFRRKTTKLLPGRLPVSLRNRKSIRETKSKKSAQATKWKKLKEPTLKKKISEKKGEKKEETPKLGKRCRLGGKAKIKPITPQEIQEKNDSDDDSDSTYFSRISLGHFQQLKDKSGASTSYESEEERPYGTYLQQNKTEIKNSEEEELKELQMWGRNVLDTYFCTLKNYGHYRKSLGHVNK